MTGIVVLIAQLLGDFETGIGMVAEEAQKILALDEVDLARVDGFGGQLVGFSGHGSAQAQDFARFGDFQDERFAVGGANREFHSPFTKDEYAAGRLALYEQNRPLWIGSGIFDGFESLQRRGIQVAENAVGPHFAGQAALDNVQTVW